PENSHYYIANSPQLLTKDVARKILTRYLLMIWNVDLEEAKKGLPNPDNKHWVDMCQRELDTIGELETYDEVYNYFLDFVHEQSDRSTDLYALLMGLFVKDANVFQRS
ncbi:MAG: hypothetical protein KAQ85_10915, partial [Thermodesulfovibrionia bacterium]|nr:hypothetical protein [Thermodesulfovibrionia bacterium]